MPAPEALAKALRWPTFLFSVFALQFDVAFLVLTYRIKWGKGLKDIHRVTVLKVGSRELYRQTCMYLCNHRSWADFLVDQYVTEGRTCFVGRFAVMAAFPLVIIPLKVTRCAIMFKRGHIADIEGFNNWLDTQFANSPQTGLGIYPEGHRSTHGESLPLKRGMLKYAFSRKLPVQIVIGGNKESILSEKQCTAHFNQTVAVGFSEVLKPEEYPDFEIFMQKVQSTWDAQWREVFSSNWEGLQAFPEVEEPQFDYPMDIRIIMAICAVLNILIVAVVARSTWWLVAGIFSLLGFLKWPVALILGVYIVASFYAYSRPGNMGLIRQKMLQERKQAPPVVAAEAAPAETVARGKEE